MTSQSELTDGASILSEVKDDIPDGPRDGVGDRAVSEKDCQGVCAGARQQVLRDSAHVLELQH